jgi:hypothetical protein
VRRQDDLPTSGSLLLKEQGRSHALDGNGETGHRFQATAMSLTHRPPDTD